MAGQIRGIYPDTLTLEATPGASLYCFETLDVGMVSDALPITDAAGHTIHVMQSDTRLYDKRRNVCYRGIPIVQYTHVQHKFIQCGYNIMLGQLYRLRELITDSNNYVLECARLVMRMQYRGDKASILWRSCSIICTFTLTHLGIPPTDLVQCNLSEAKLPVHSSSA